MATQAPPPTARKNYLLSALIAARAVREAAKARPRGLGAVAKVVASHQVATAVMSQRAMAQMLAEQEIDVAADALLNSTAFTTEVETFTRMAESAGDDGFDRLVESLVQDAARAAESVSVAVRPDIYHVRFVNLPCCSRCAVLAGRVYRFSDGFQRHPGCDCSMIPTTVASPLRQSPEDLFEQGQIRGLSKADVKAIHDGADLGQVVNIRRKAAGLREPGRVLSRTGRPTPEGIYRMASNRGQAVELLAKFGYVR